MPARAERLLELLQALRGHRRPAAAATLAETLGVSLRTLYRDIQSLRAQGADIAGEAGVGYLLRPGFTLPPLMFTPEEIDALALGALWVRRNGDSALAGAAERAMAKIAAVTPKGGGEFLNSPTQIVGSRRGAVEADRWMPELRPGGARRAQGHIRLCRRQGGADAADRLADCARLSGRDPDGRGLVRDPRRVSPFPR